MTIWRDHDARCVPVGGTGSISCLGITEDQGRQAEERRIPIGFTPGSVVPAAATPASWGEALWTARDLR